MNINDIHNVGANRSAVKYSHFEYFLRILWWPGSLLFKVIPRPFYAFRSALLRLYGAKIGQQVHIHNSVDIMFPWNLCVGDYSAIGDAVRVYNLGLITIGQNVTVSQGVHLCAGTHDHRQPDFPLLKPPIVIRDGAWIAADAFVGPGVTVGELAIVGARACVVRDLPMGVIAVGNPARLIGQRDLSAFGERAP